MEVFVFRLDDLFLPIVYNHQVDRRYKESFHFHFLLPIYRPRTTIVKRILLSYYETRTYAYVSKRTFEKIREKVYEKRLINGADFRLFSAK